jgi:FtsP/CotA-like multicopper oxidase with cupredoxin domain
MRRFSTTIIASIVLALIFTGLFFAFKPTTNKPETKATSVKITGAGMTPNNISYNQGDTTHLTFTSSIEGTIHIHGYDVELPVSVNQAAQIDLKLSRAGRFEIELHHDNGVRDHDHSGQPTHGSDKTIPIGFLDVQPRNP